METSQDLEEKQVIDGYGGQIIKIRQISLYLEMGRLRHPSFLVCMYPVTEYTVGVGVLQDLDLTRAEFRLHDLSSPPSQAAAL